jgi:DNA-binding beta-propeller fold protein YncE
LTLRPSGFIALPVGERTGFDHADTYLDRGGSRLYVAHTAMNGVDVLDCRSNSYLRSLTDLPGVAGVFIDSQRDLLFTSDRGAARVSVLPCSDETLLARVDVGPRPNGLAFDTRRGHLYSFNLGEPPGTGCTASVVAVDEPHVVATVALPGRPRWAVFDPSSDRVFVAIQNPATLLAIDAGTLVESHRIEVGAEGPHGLALVGRRLFCAADGGELVVIDDGFTSAGRVVAKLPLRGSPDVVMHDEPRRRLYVAIGSPGVVTVFDTERLEELQTVETEDGAHTIGWDPVTAQLYAFAPQRGGALVFEETA